MIARWLHVAAGYSVADAVEHCAVRRPPGIYKAEYVAALHELCAAAIPQSVPKWPAWRCARLAITELHPVARRAFENRGHAVSMPEAFAASQQAAASEFGEAMPYVVRADQREAAVTPGIVVTSTAAEACGCPGAVTFCGTQPVALGRKHFEQLRNRHLVSWKADGVRVIVVALAFGTFTINRRNEVRFLSVCFL